MRAPRRSTAVLLALLAAGAFYASTTSNVIANGDPASDVLLQKDVFLPLGASVCSPLKDAVDSAAGNAYHAGWPIKVAVIASAYDLGTEPDFFGHPAGYAKFLGGELGAYSTHLKRRLIGVPLLVVMPQGLALWNADPSLNAVLRTVQVAPDADVATLTRAALKAVPKLAAAAGHPTDPIADPSCSSSGSTVGRIVPFVVPVLLVVLVGVALRFRRSEQAG
jgi:hypothetical protein